MLVCLVLNAKILCEVNVFNNKLLLFVTLKTFYLLPSSGHCLWTESS